MTKKNNQEDIVTSKKSEEVKEEAEETVNQEDKVDEATQEFYKEYEALVNRTGKIIAPEVRVTPQGIYPVLTITNVPEQKESK